MNRIPEIVKSPIVWRLSVPCVAVIAACFFAVLTFRSHHHQAKLDEIDALEKGVVDIFNHEWASVLPDSIVRYLPVSIAQDFKHVTEIDLLFSDLSFCSPADIRDLHRCEWVHTVRIPNPTMTAEMYEAIIGFPRLRTIYYRHWFESRSEHPVAFETAEPSGIRVVLVE